MSAHNAAYTIHNRVALLDTGRAYFERMEALIDGAVRNVHLHVYIFNDDATGQRIGDALVRAAQRGVTVFLFIDRYANRHIPDGLEEALDQAGGHFSRFEPIWRSRYYYIGRRLHHKVLVVDHRYALVSGRNIADRYMDLPEEPAWYDLSLEVEGEAAMDLADLCCTLWNRSMRRTRLELATPPTEQEREALRSAWAPDEHCAVRVRFNDWLRRSAEITHSYAELLGEAKDTVHLVSSYFIPGRQLKGHIARAAARGVRVVVMTAGQADVVLSKPAERWLYPWLLRNNVEVYEYRPTVLHAKYAICDKEWLTAGSFNFNDLSAYTTLEVNLDVHDAGMATKLRAHVQHLLEQECDHISLDDEHHVPWFERLGRWAAYQIVRGVHGLVTSYYQRER